MNNLFENDETMTCKDGKESFIMYGSFLKAAECLDGNDFKDYILKLRDYALYGEESESENALVNSFLIMAKPNLRAAADRYQRCVDNGSLGKDYGEKGGRPRKGETREEYRERKGLEKTPRKPLNDNDDDNWNENVTVDVKKNVDVKFNIDEKNNKNRNNNLNNNAPSGTLYSNNSCSFSSSSLNPKSSKGAGTSNTRSEEAKNTNCSSNLVVATNAAAANAEVIDPDKERRDREYEAEMRGYLTVFANAALDLCRLKDFDYFMDKAIACYMEHNGGSRGKAAKAIEVEMEKYRESIERCMEAVNRKPQEQIEQEIQDDMNDLPF